MNEEIQLGLIVFGLPLSLYVALVAWFRYGMSPEENNWRKDKKRCLKYIRWLRRAYYGVRLED